MVMHGARYLSFVDNVRVFEVPFYKGLDLLLFWRDDITWREYYSWYAMCIKCSYKLYEVISMSYFSLNLMIYCDLYFILKNPFKPQLKRLPSYFIFVIFSCIVMLSMTYIDFFADENIYYFYTFVFVTYFSGISYTLSYTIYRLK